MDLGRKAYLDLIASKDAVVRRLLDEGYEFVTNAFAQGSQPPNLRTKDAEATAAQLLQQGYLAEVCTAYNEAGDPIAVMRSVWRKARGAHDA